MLELLLMLVPLELSLELLKLQLVSLSLELVLLVVCESPSLSPGSLSLVLVELLTLSPASLLLELDQLQPPQLQCPACAADAPNSSAASAADAINFFMLNPFPRLQSSKRPNGTKDQALIETANEATSAALPANIKEQANPPP